MTGSHTSRPARHDIHVTPLIVIWEVTRTGHPGELDTDEGRALLDSLATWHRSRPQVVLTGPGILGRGDLTELIRHGTGLGLEISLSLPVAPGLDRRKLAELYAAGVTTLALTLDGAAAATHDQFHDVPGAFDRTIRAAREATLAGLRLQINSTLTPANLAEAPALLARVIGLGARQWNVSLLVPTDRGTGRCDLSGAEHEDVLHWLRDVSDRIVVEATDAPQLRRVFHQRAQGADHAGGELYGRLTTETVRLLGARPAAPRRPRPPMVVNAGSGLVVIGPAGDVRPDRLLPVHCGNIRESPLPEIYAQSPVLRRLRDPSTWTGGCTSCEFAGLCGGSRAAAYAVSGDPLASDPTCPYVPEGREFPETDRQPV
ncbi:radical SAM/SPASM domain-containing protein [Corynebacterium hylobatis]|uniref:Radical SAM/SPASM domain-containing protein n=1 Tax=Corynebacterium hylobatis TaxID=1859290 RepID=A0A430HWX6_9CORY|nr:radical SAM/SPASM domain-containing protein [Corynebacterium hylobatis]RSZ62069.1 radical SAM/SPASM domain-containing protein [Corynebacterium hylobatis]